MDTMHMDEKPLIRMMDADDNALIVAELIYGTDGMLFPFLFGQRQKAVQKLAKLVSMERNSFSHKHIAVYDEQGIKGIIIFFSSLKENEDKELNDFIKVFTLPQSKKSECGACFPWRISCENT
jgi:hypothetical protein